MTPKEKAIELLDQFMEHTVEWDNVTEYAFDSEYHAKQCALIAVDEIINERYFYIDHYNQANLKYHLELELSKRLEATRIYWQEVKQEINKL
jgi:hypothetical protein